MFITTYTFIYNVISICAKLNRENYVVILNESDMSDNPIKLQYIYDILNQHGVEYKDYAKNNLDGLNEYFHYKYWLFGKPYSKYSDTRVIKYIKNTSEYDNIFIGIQPGILFSNELMKQYFKNINFMITFGNHWRVKNKSLNLLPFGSPKTSLYKNISETYFVIFTQPYHRAGYHLKKKGRFDYKLFFKIIIESIIKLYGSVDKIVIAEHPTAHFTNSEPYIKNIVKKYGIKCIDQTKLLYYINNMKVGFTFSSTVAFELRAVNKELIIVNVCPKSSFHFPFRKHSFKVATNHNQLISHMKSHKLVKNINNLMRGGDPASRVIKFMNDYHTQSQASVCIMGKSFKNVDFESLKNKITIGTGDTLNYLMKNKINFIPSIICLSNKQITHSFFSSLTYLKYIKSCQSPEPIIIINPLNKKFQSKNISKLMKVYHKFNEVFVIKSFSPFTLCHMLNIGNKQYTKNFTYCRKYRQTIPMICMLISQKMNFKNIQLLQCDELIKTKEYLLRHTELTNNNINISNVQQCDIQTITTYDEPMKMIMLSTLNKFTRQIKNNITKQISQISQIPTILNTSNIRKNITLRLNSHIEKNKLKQSNSPIKRCFIIANGPSLKKINLNLLKNEFTIACNYFLIGAEKTYPNFCPTVLCMGDRMVGRNALSRDYNTIIKFKKQPIIVMHPSHGIFINKKRANPKSTYRILEKRFNTLQHAYSIYNFPKFTLFKFLKADMKNYRKNYSKYCKKYSNVIPMISMLIAEKVNVKKMCILGVDLGNVFDHFYEFKSHSNLNSTIYSNGAYANIHKGFQRKKDEYGDKINVVNCNLDSQLKIFPFVTLDKILNIMFVTYTQSTLNIMSQCDDNCIDQYNLTNIGQDTSKILLRYPSYIFLFLTIGTEPGLNVVNNITTQTVTSLELNKIYKQKTTDIVKSFSSENKLKSFTTFLKFFKLKGFESIYYMIELVKNHSSIYQQFHDAILLMNSNDVTVIESLQ